MTSTTRTAAKKSKVSKLTTKKVAPGIKSKSIGIFVYGAGSNQLLVVRLFGKNRKHLHTSKPIKGLRNARVYAKHLLFSNEVNLSIESAPEVVKVA